MSKFIAALKAVLTDLVKLKDPHTDAMVLALIVAVVSPFNVNVGSTGSVILAVLATVGLVASIAIKILGQIKTGQVIPPASLK